jgi:gliding motility-associated-like protein
VGTCGLGVCDTIVLSIGAPPQVGISGATVLCTGSFLTLTASGADAYAWSTGATTASIQVNTTGTYTVTGSNACGQDTASVVVTPAQPLVVAISGDTLLCPGETTTLTATAGVTYQWSSGQTTQAISVGTPGAYFVTVSNGCTSGTAQAQVLGVALNAAFTASPLSGPAPLPVTFTNGSTPSTAASAWSFGDGNLSADGSPVHTFGEAGTYTVVLTVTDAGCSDEATLTIVVDPAPQGSPSVFIPNVFSPNGDGQNDQLEVITNRITSLSMSIYNRWGQEVGALKNADERWDGRTGSGVQVVDGTYFYVLQAVADDGAVFERSGSLTLLR